MLIIRILLVCARVYNCPEEWEQYYTLEKAFQRCEDELLLQGSIQLAYLLSLPLLN